MFKFWNEIQNKWTKMLDGWCIILYTIHQENGIKD